jgi:alpha-glucosidase
VKFLGYINTFLKQDTVLYKEAEQKGFLVLNKEEKPYLIKSTTFWAGIVDLTDPEAYAWYKEIIKTNMIDLGLSGWMADFGEYLPTDAVIKGGSAEKFHNRWPTLWAKCNYEAIRERGKEKEVFIFSRAAYGHTTKYVNSMWNGDQHVDYSDEYGLGSVIPRLAVDGLFRRRDGPFGYRRLYDCPPHEERSRALQTVVGDEYLLPGLPLPRREPSAFQRPGLR